jgi:REP element-mobilizing transposase RayT
MVRPLRIEFPGAVYHITSRGDKKENIFKNDKDREGFLEVVDLVVKRYNFFCHAYCLMDNHYHLLIETPDGNLSQGIRQLNGVYTQKFNKIHNTVGHLFQGRYKAILIEKESYLLELCRYIVLNPVRAGIVKYPWEWKWSNYTATTDKAKRPKFLTTDWILSQFDEEQKKAERAYEEFVLAGIGKEAPWKDLKGRFILGKNRFFEKIKSYLEEKKEIKEIPRIERFAVRKGLSEIFKEIRVRKERDNQIYIAHIKYSYTLKEIADHLEIHYSTVSKALKRFMKELGNE